jgi:hypothetical protein
MISLGLDPKRTSLKLARLVERIAGIFGEKRLTGAVFLDVAKAFESVRIDGLLYKLTILNFPSYIVTQSHRTSEVGRSKRPSTRPRHLVEAYGLGVAQGELILPVLFSIYVDMPSPSHHVELALYADDTAIIAMSRKPMLLVSYLESYLDLQWWLSEWRIAINVSNCTAIIFARAGRRFIQP